ncbi:MAG: M56 family metallopeptidase [Clostridia bacterium]|nr:M56 family metallopeptidase [Clostridia bacterium]
MRELLHMSLRGGVMIAAVILLRALLLDRLPKRTFMALWLVAALTLLLPWTASARTSVWSLLEPQEQEAAAAVWQPLAGIYAEARVPEMAEGAKTAAEASRAFPWAVLYAAAAALLAVLFLSAWLYFRLRLRNAVPAEAPLAREYIAAAGLRRRVSVRELQAAGSPLTYGVLRPVILLAASTEWRRSERLDAVFAHELWHIRRFDALKKGLLILTLCVHWFNPLVWAMFILANRDIELCCDEAVVSGMGMEKRRAYALMLLEMEEARTGLGAVMSGLGQNAIKQRVRSVMKMKKTGVISIILAAALILGVYAVFGTAGSAGEDSDTKSGVLLLNRGESESKRETRQSDSQPESVRSSGGDIALVLPGGSADNGSNFSRYSRIHGSGGGEVRGDMPFGGLQEGAPVKLNLIGTFYGRLEFGICDLETGEKEYGVIEADGFFNETIELAAPRTGTYRLFCRQFREREDAFSFRYRYAANVTAASELGFTDEQRKVW